MQLLKATFWFTCTIKTMECNVSKKSSRELRTWWCYTPVPRKPFKPLAFARSCWSNMGQATSVCICTIIMSCAHETIDTHGCVLYFTTRIINCKKNDKPLTSYNVCNKQYVTTHYRSIYRYFISSA